MRSDLLVESSGTSACSDSGLESLCDEVFSLACERARTCTLTCTYMHASGLIDRRSLHLTLAALVVEPDALPRLRDAFEGDRVFE